MKPRKALKPAAIGDKMPDRVDPSPTPGDSVGDEEVGGLVRRAMASLEPEERSLLEQRFVDGRTIIEISEAIGISTETVKATWAATGASSEQSSLTRSNRIAIGRNS